MYPANICKLSAMSLTLLKLTLRKNITISISMEPTISQAWQKKRGENCSTSPYLGKGANVKKGII